MTASDISSYVQLAVSLLTLIVLTRKVGGVKEERKIINHDQDPVIVKEAEKFVTKETHELFKADVERRTGALDRRVSDAETKLDNHVTRLEVQGESRAAKLHARLDKIAEEMPQRIITLLQTTGALKR